MRDPERAFQAILLCLAAACAAVFARPIDPSPAQRAARKAVSEKLPGARLLWVRDGRILFAALDDFRPRAIGGKGKQSGPRWSPDGRRFLFVRDSKDVWLMNADLTGARLVMNGAHTASWTPNGTAITAIASDGRRVLRYDTASRKTTVLVDVREDPLHGQELSQAAELDATGRYLLTFRRQPKHYTEIIDLRTKRLLANKGMRRGDCSPAWSPDGRTILTTARTASRPVLAAMFDPNTGKLGESKPMVRLPAKQKYYIHGQRFSNDGKWIVCGGIILGGPDRDARREIYLQPARPGVMPVRLTFDTGEDGEPDLYVPQGGETGPTPTDREKPSPATAPAESITVLSPNGGETLQAGRTCVIRWKTVGIDDVQIGYSTDGGKNWTTISDSVDKDNQHWLSYPWRVPDVDSANCLIEVRGYFGQAPDESDRIFRIHR